VKSIQNHKIWRHDERPVLGWEGIADVDLEYMEYEGMDCSTGSGLGTVSSSSRYYNEPEGFMYGVEFLHWLITITF
jgi:hypothetical protein